MESLTNEDTVNSKIHLPGLVQSNALFLETQALGVFGHAKQAKICLEYVFFVKAKTDEKIFAKGVSYGPGLLACANAYCSFDSAITSNFTQHAAYFTRKSCSGSSLFLESFSAFLCSSSLEQLPSTL